MSHGKPLSNRDFRKFHVGRKKDGHTATILRCVSFARFSNQIKLGDAVATGRAAPFPGRCGADSIVIRGKARPCGSPDDAVARKACAQPSMSRALLKLGLNPKLNSAYASADLGDKLFERITLLADKCAVTLKAFRQKRTGLWGGLKE